MGNSEFPSPAVEAIYAEIGQIPTWQLFVDVFKKLARGNSIGAHEEPQPNPIGKEITRLDGVSTEESVLISLEFTKDGEKKSIGLRVPGGLFLSSRWSDDTPGDPVFILEASGLYTMNEISEDAAFLLKVARTFKDLTLKA